MKDKLIPVNVVIADRTYRLKIEQDDEEMVRNTVKLINEKIVDYKTNFSGKDMQDYVSMVLLWFATEQEKPTIVQSDNALQTEKLTKFEQMLDKALAQ